VPVNIDLQHIVDQAAGRPIHLDPRDSFEIQSPSLKLKGQVELYGHGAALQHDRRWPRKSAPLVSGPNVTGIIDGLVLVGTKDPASRSGTVRSSTSPVTSPTSVR
jgi:hypothetical protein